ncbi:MAG: hypothetical protein ACE5KM_10515 [Planctomycetaceae bacterium]
MANTGRDEIDDDRSPTPRETAAESVPRMNPLFRLALVPAVLFIVTVLGFTATQFGNADAPLPRWLNANVGWLIAVEVAGSVLLATTAVAVDRRNIASKTRPADSGSRAGAPTVTGTETRV